MQALAHEIELLFREAVHTAFPDLSSEELLRTTVAEEPKNSEHGDYACSVALKLSKMLGEKPKVIAEKIIEAFPKDYRVADLSFAEPGFLNLTLSEAFLAECLKNLESGFSVERGVLTSPKENRPVIVEYCGTNAAKHMGVHHILTTIIGDALANLFEFMGCEVIRINHLGDWGTHFGKLIYAVEHWGDPKLIHANPNEELMKLYVRFHEEEEKNPQLSEEARMVFKSLEEDMESSGIHSPSPRMEMWRWIVQESLEDLKKVLVRLGVEFDHITGESFYLKIAEEVLREGREKGLFVEGEEEALIFNMGPDQTPALIQKGDGTTLYLTRDVATVKYRVETWQPANILYVVDTAQSLHFQQNFAIAKALGYAPNTELEHVSFGRMNFADGAMSTRKGKVIRLDQLLDEAVKRAGALSADRGTELPREDWAALMEIVGVGSVKYAVLSQDRQRDMLFDWDKIITLEGNSAPYLLYSYARAKSIVNKLPDFPLSGLPQFSHDMERSLIRKMAKFADAFEHALNERKPHIVCTALYELAQEFNRFYGTVSVVGAENDTVKRTRLGMVDAFLHQMKAGLSILGIPVLERM